VVQILHTFGNDNLAGELTGVRQLGLRLPLETRPRDGHCVFFYNDEQGGGAYGVHRGETILARQPRYESCIVETGGDTEGDALRTETARLGFYLLHSEGLGMVCDIPHMREEYPKAWSVSADSVLDIQLCPPLDAADYADADATTSDRLYYYLRDGIYRFRRGVTKTHQIVLAFESASDQQPWERAAQIYGGSGVCRAPANWYAQSRAAGLTVPRTEGEFTEYDARVDRDFSALEERRKKLGEYGMLNYGDWWGERGYNWGNLEYDTAHVYAMEWMRDPSKYDLLMRSAEAAVHNRDVDGVHYAENPRDVGTVHAHSMFHTGGYTITGEQGIAMDGGGFNRGHVWTRGLFDHAVLLGDRRSMEWALVVSDYLAGPFTVGFSVGNHAERDTAWPLFGVLAAYEYTADPYYLNAARLMVDDVLRRQSPETGNWGFPAGYSKAVPQPTGGYAWCCGLLITALNQYNEYVQDPRVDEAIVRAARWLVRDEWVKDKQGFRATSCPTFNAGTPAGGACWSCANAMLIAYELTGEQEFLSIARKGYALQMRGTSDIGKTVTQTICLGPETLWRLKEAGIKSLAVE